jgi:hypothetical protein
MHMSFYWSEVPIQLWNLCPSMISTDKKTMFLINISEVQLHKEIKFTDILLLVCTCDCHILKQWQVSPGIFVANINMDIHDDT